MNLNRNDEPDPMAATTASGGVLGNRADFNENISKKKRGAFGGRQPPEFVPEGPLRAAEARAAGPPFQAARCPSSHPPGDIY